MSISFLRWFSKLLPFLLFAFHGWLSPTAEAQKFYPYQDLQQGSPDPNLAGVLGLMYNPAPYPIIQGNTYFHGSANFYGTMYLLNPIEEYDYVHALVPLSPYYTTGLSMCSLKIPFLELYAPIEIAAVDYDPVDGLLDKYYPFASTVTTPFYTGPFNKLPTLNEEQDNFKHPLNEVLASSVLEATQKFTKLTHTLFGWDGFDKQGQQCITSLIDKRVGLTRYNYQTKIIHHHVADFTSPTVSRDLVGHELAHGLLHMVPTLGDAAYEGYEDNPIPLHELMEFFCDVMGLANRNYYALPAAIGFAAPTWTYGSFQGSSPNNHSLRPFNNPKPIYGYPSTYKGDYYRKINAPGYTPQSNGMVGDYWFYLLASGEKKAGFIDDNQSLGAFEVLPLDPDNKFNCYKLALEIVFRTFTGGKITLQSDYPDAREKTLQTVVELGYPIGSHVYQQVMNAWHAVGVGSRWSPGTHNVVCLTDGQKLSAESWVGTVKFNAQKSTIYPDPTSHEIHTLHDCSQSPEIRTKQYVSEDEDPTYFIDADLDANKIYTLENDINASKNGVTVHFLNGLASSWFKKKFNYSGLNGLGNMPVESVLGSSAKAFTYPAYDPVDKILYYPTDKSVLGWQQLISQYFFGINYFVKNELIAYNNVDNPEWEAILNGLGSIFALNVKNEYIKTIDPNGADIWVLTKDNSNAPALDFTNPNNSNQPKFYRGIYWDYDIPSRNAGILNFWYYLLVNGTDGINGYKNEQDQSYFVFPLDKEFVLKLIWKAYLTTPVNSSIEQFRLATHSALAEIMGANFDPKGKEYIALTDAWAAVLGLPDYASSLAHFPIDGSIVYPWAAHVGVEVEYPKLESARLFEVSKSLHFKPNEAPVYQFVNNVAPDLSNGMTFGDVNLEPGQTYYVRSRLSQSGDPRLGCQATPDPVLCEALKTKQKWTITYELKTGELPEILPGSPLASGTAPAWATPFSWSNVPGALDYKMKITDNSGAVPEQVVGFPNPDEAPEYQFSQEIALGQEKSYTYMLTARQKLGSEWECHVLPNGTTIAFTQAEKDALEDFYIPWTAPITFETDQPMVTLGNSPTDKEHVPILGPDLTLSASDEPRADHYRFFISEQPVQPILDKPEMSVKVSDLKGLDDQKAYQWTVDVLKDPVLPFIPQQEKGKGPAPHSFIADMSLSPAPDIKGTDCIVAGKAVRFEWEPVKGATRFTLDIFDGNTNKHLAQGSTTTTGMNINDVSKFPQPANYTWTVKAGVENANGDAMFGPASTSSYQVGPPPCFNLQPNQTSSSYGGSNLNEGGLTLSWEADFAPEGYWLSVFNLNENNLEVDQKVNTNSVLIKGLNFDATYHWKVKPIGAEDDCNWAEADFRTYGTGQNYKSKVEVTDQGDTGGSMDGNDSPGGNGDQDPPAEEGPCPGSFVVSMVNFGHLEIAILSNKLGDGQVFEGITDINTQEFIPLLGDGQTIFPKGAGQDPVFKANDQVVLRIKVKSLDGTWADIPFDEIPVVTFTTSGGQVMTHTFNFEDWQLDKEILMGTYHCANE